MGNNANDKQQLSLINYFGEYNNIFVIPTEEGISINGNTNDKVFKPKSIIFNIRKTDDNKNIADTNTAYTSVYITNDLGELLKLNFT